MKVTITISFNDLVYGGTIPEVGTIKSLAESTPPKPQPKNRYVVVKPLDGGPVLHGHLKEGQNKLVLTPVNEPVRVHN